LAVAAAAVVSVVVSMVAAADDNVDMGILNHELPS
jgi:hypothetical protein